MAVKEILMIGNNDLRQNSQPIDFDKDNPHDYIKDLKDTLHFYQKQKNIGRAIAAPQIGYFKNIIYMESSNTKIIMINPKILNKSQETFEVWDSCFSADTAFFGKTKRHKEIEVEYYTENREKKNQVFTDDLSELFQHEIDHLHGILFTDHIIDNQIIMRSEWEKIA